MPPIGLGIIGVGSIVRFAHIPALQFIEDFHLRGVHNSRPETTRAAAERYRTRAFDRVEDLLAQPDIDAVLIATPSSKHEPMMRAALAAGKHVFCETPATVSSPTAGRDLLAAAAAKRLILQAGHCFRYSPLVDLLQEHVREATGPRLWAFEYFPYIGHIYNLALYLAGPVQRVVGSVASPAGSTATLAFQNGDAAVIVGRSINNCALDIETIRVSTNDFYGAIEGRRRVRIAKNLKGIPFDQWATRTAGSQVFEAQAGGRLTLDVTGYIPQLRAFAHSIRTGTLPRCTLTDTMETAALGAAIAAAAAQ